MENNLKILESYNFIYKEINKLKNKYNRIKKGINETNLDDSSHLKLFNDLLIQQFRKYTYICSK